MRALKTTICFAVCAFAAVLGCKKQVPAPAAAPPPAVEQPAPAHAMPPPEPEPAPSPPANIAHIKVTNDGKITVNGTATSLADIKKLLTDPAKKPTEIRYQRENPDQEPAPTAVETVRGLLEAIMESKIPVKLAS